MKATELRTQTIAELKSAETAARRERFKLRLQKAGGEMTNTSPIKSARKELARILTVLREKERLSKQEGK